MSSFIYLLLLFNYFQILMNARVVTTVPLTPYVPIPMEAMHVGVYEDMPAMDVVVKVLIAYL